MADELVASGAQLLELLRSTADWWLTFDTPAAVGLTIAGAFTLYVLALWVVGAIAPPDQRSATHSR